MTSEWLKKQVGAVATLQRGFDLPHRLRNTGSVPIVTSSGIEHFHSLSRVNGPGVVTGRYGTIGNVYFVEPDFWPLNTTLYVKDFHGNDPLFISYLLRTLNFKEHSGKSGVPGINRNDIHEIEVALPPTKAEQEAIAEALSDADGLIESLEQLIAKKRLLKQGAMQELLTGNQRLPGFEGEWVEKTIDEICSTDPENLSSKTGADYRFKYISLEDINFGSLESYTEQFFETAPSRARRQLKSGDVLVSTVRPNLKSHYLFTHKGSDWVCSTGFAVLRSIPSQSDPRFVFAHFFGHTINEQIEALLTGSNYPAISSREVKKLQIPLPPTLAEQTAIAEILSEMDAEIAALETKRDKARRVKEGMMQELLTGKTRLVGCAENSKS